MNFVLLIQIIHIQASYYRETGQFRFNLLLNLLIFSITTCNYGVLFQDIIANDGIELDWAFRHSLINDIVQVCVWSFLIQYDHS